MTTGPTAEQKRAALRVSRGTARIANTEDGKALFASLRQAIAWDEAGPVDPSTESLQFWTGQRSVFKMILDHIEKGKKALSNEDETEPNKNDV
jgi:hypothetical protein